MCACVRTRQTWGQIFIWKYLNIFLKYLIFKYFGIWQFQILFQIHCQYQHLCLMITCNACQTDYLHCKSPSFHQTIKLFLTFKIPIDCNFNVVHPTVLITGDTWQQVSPMALAMTTTFVCSQPEDGLAPGSDHRSIPPLFFRQALSWHQAILVSRLSFKLSCHTSSQDPTSHWLNLTKTNGIYLCG